MNKRVIEKKVVLDFLKHLNDEYRSLPKNCRKEINYAIKFWSDEK